VLRQSNVAAAIIGASRPEQIDENVAASGHALSPELAHRAEALIAAAS
jgi:aryl-alcohol dehydrogenase-like predicted oxidoreductase